MTEPRQRVDGPPTADADRAADWTRRKADAWAIRHQITDVTTLTPAETVRLRTLETLASIADAMARTATPGGNPPFLGYAEHTRAWLANVCDDASRADPETSPDRLTTPLGDGRRENRDGCSVRRWNASFHILMEELGIRWMRGAERGSARFDVVEHEKQVAIVEHGNSTDDGVRHEQILDAAAHALVRQARNEGRETASPKDLRAALATTAHHECLALDRRREAAAAREAR